MTNMVPPDMWIMFPPFSMVFLEGIARLLTPLRVYDYGMMKSMPEKRSYSMFDDENITLSMMNVIWLGPADLNMSTVFFTTVTSTVDPG